MWIVPHYCGKRPCTLRQKHILPFITNKSYVQALEMEYTHNSTATEGNTLALLETEIVVEEGLFVGGKKLREIFEVVGPS